MSRDQKIIDDVKCQLEIHEIPNDAKKAIEKLISLYQKSLTRFEKVMKQSDKMSATVASQKEHLEALSLQLAKYLSPQIYDMIFKNQGEAKLQTKRKKLTIFFSDIVDFTATTENLEPEVLTELLNHYLTEMSQIALSYGGTIDKYIGDAIVVFFGDPESKGYHEDAKACVEMAIAMRDRLGKFRQHYINEGIIRDFRVRMGITTGYCTVGNFGSDERMDYTIIGGNVNLAARLESSAPPDTILVAHETYALTKEAVLYEPFGEIEVKGFSKPIEAYRVCLQEQCDMGVMQMQTSGFQMHLDMNQLKDIEATKKHLKNVIARLEKESNHA